MKKIIFYFFLLVFKINTFSQEFTLENIKYSTNLLGTGEVKVIDYLGETGIDVSIPSQAENNNQIFSIVRIDNHAFNSKNITGVQIPEGVKLIGDDAFRNNSLTSIVIPSSVDRLLYDAFRDNQLSEVVFSESMQVIMGGSFQNNNLKTIELPAGITEIERNAFLDNPLEMITLKSLVPPSFEYFLGNSDNSFENVDQIDIIVPVGTLNLYLNSQWSIFKSIEEEGTTLNLELTTLKQNDLIIEKNILNINILNFKKVLMYDLMGKKVLTSIDKIINFSLLPAGIYILNIELDNEIITKKILLK